MYHRVKRGSSMKKTFIVANWKSNKTILQAKEWFKTFNSLRGEAGNSQLTINREEKEIIICPPFTLLPFVRESIVKGQLSIAVGAQDISPFEEGAYTGEINGKQIKEFADFVLIGHSERRKNFLESDETLFKKAELANKCGLTPIFCVQGRETRIPTKSSIVAYEPINAIGTGYPDTPENAQAVASFFKKNYNVAYVLYGGSVTSKDVKEFTKTSDIDGVLVGGASLDAKEFSKIIKNA